MLADIDVEIVSCRKKTKFTDEDRLRWSELRMCWLDPETIAVASTDFGGVLTATHVPNSKECVRAVCPSVNGISSIAELICDLLATEMTNHIAS